MSDETKSGTQDQAEQTPTDAGTTNEGAEVNVNAEDGATVNVGEPQAGSTEE